MIQPTSHGTDEWTPQRVVLTTLGTVGVGLSFWLLFRFHSVVFILFAALVLSTATRPAVDWLYRRKLSRTAGLILVNLGLLALLVGFLALLAPMLIQQTRGMIDKMPAYYRDLHAWLAASGRPLLQRLAMQLPAVPTIGLLGQAGGALSLGTVGLALGYVGAAWKVLFIIAAILALAAYWTLDGEHILRVWLRRVPTEHRAAWHDLVSEMETRVGAYIRGVAILSLAVGCMATFAYLVIGLPSALVLGVLAGVFEAIPVLGPILGAILPVLLALSLAPEKVIWVVVATVVIQQAEGNLLVPRVMDRAVGVTPIVTILAILAFGTLWGLPGAVLAIPLAAMIQIVLGHLVTQREAAHAEQPEGRTQVSTLRYEAQELAQDVRQQMRYKKDASDGEGDDIEDLIEVAVLGLDRILAQAVELQEAE